MPNYLYRCSQGHDTERFYRMGEKPKTTSCQCGKKSKNVIVMPPIQFKGEGFSRAVRTPEQNSLKGKTFADKETAKFYQDNNLVPKDDIVVNL